ncbi:ABC transporter permease [Pseudoalteromonas rubra]|uniref:ABC transmembrane type-2 domain-containing protein n=1 Tax=Pseudoalteromonas rubra TaxID=43658 RepID=A0A0F4QUU4_9GAMM|nr:ABC transporter permease [Pseudoalteromonas rubra]KJZ11438.1 hypothetical protein TW77_06070 [Pseudoalteromonas rubra]
MIKLNRVFALFKTQSVEFKRDFGSIFFSFIFPLFFVVILIFSNLLEPNFSFKVGVINNTTGVDARVLHDALSKRFIDVVQVKQEDVESALENAKLNVVFVFSGEAGHIQSEVIVKEAYQTYAEMLIRIVLQELNNPQGANAIGNNYSMQPYESKVDGEFNFMFPGMLAMALLQLGLFATATPVLKAREKGVFRYMLTSPLRVAELLTSQILFRLLIAVLQITVIVSCGYYFLNITASSLFYVILVSLLGALMLISMGYFLAGLMRSQESGMALIMIANFSMLFAGNIFMDASSDDFLYYVSHIFPVSYLADTYRQIIVGSEGVWPIYINISMMVIFLFSFVFLGVRYFKFDMDSEMSGMLKGK